MQKTGKMLIHEKTTKKNKAIKKVRNASVKSYSKTRNSVINNKLGKVVYCANNEQTNISSQNSCIKYDNISANQLIKLCKDSELVGMSGSCFPVYKKLTEFAASTASQKTILINGAECEPGLIHDQWLIDNKFSEIADAAKLLKSIFNADRTLIAAKNFPIENKMCVKVPPMYPMGEERILIKQVLQIDISKNEHPAQKGILVMNIQTLLCVRDIILGKPLEGRYVTLGDLDSGKAYSMYVSYGQNIKETLAKAFGAKKYFMYGTGAMNAMKLSDTDTFSPGVCFACVASEIAENNISNRCKGCGKCKRVCPMGVDVKKLVALYEKGKPINAQELNLDKCIGCGSCSFVCMAKKCPHEIVAFSK